MYKRKRIADLIISMLFIISIFTLILPSQTVDQPSAPPVITYQVQIGWGDIRLQSFMWEDIPIDEIKTLIKPFTDYQHKYSCRLLNQKNWWVWESLSFCIGSPEITAISIIPTEIKNSKYPYWGYYRIRIKATVDREEFDWSEATNWVQCLDIDYLKKTKGILNGDLNR